MSMSSFFRALRTSYQAEIDDLSFDTDGHDVLRKRLAEKRQHFRFLLQMMEASPEMVAVAFHGGFEFVSPDAMNRLLALESNEFPAWATLADAVVLAPWAEELAAMVLQQPRGDWFMATAAGLEYLYNRPAQHHHDGSHSGLANGSTVDEHSTDDHDQNKKPSHDGDDDEPREHDEDDDDAGAQWLEDQGFDAKE